MIVLLLVAATVVISFSILAVDVYVSQKQARDDLHERIAFILRR
jgi:hypothetical protein